MGFKTLALAGAATAALSLGIAAPAVAGDAPEGHGCHVACKNLPIMKNGVKYGYVNVWVHGKSIHGEVHVQKTMKPGTYTFKGHCREIRHEHEHETTTETRVVREFRHTEVRTVPSGPARTGFGGASKQADLPLTAGALSVIAGGLGLGGFAARRRLSGVRS